MVMQMNLSYVNERLVWGGRDKHNMICVRIRVRINANL